MYGEDQPVRIVTPSRVSGELLRYARAGFSSSCTPKTIYTLKKTRPLLAAEELVLVSLLNFSPFFIVRYVRSSAGIVYIGHRFFFVLFFCCLFLLLLFLCVFVFTCTLLRHQTYKLLMYAAASFEFDSNSRINSTLVIMGSLGKFEKKKNGEGRYRKYSISSSCNKQSSSCITHHSANLLDILALKFTANLHTYNYVTKGLGPILHVVGWAFLLYFYLLSTV